MQLKTCHFLRVVISFRLRRRTAKLRLKAITLQQLPQHAVEGTVSNFYRSEGFTGRWEWHRLHPGLSPLALLGCRIPFAYVYIVVFYGTWLLRRHYKVPVLYLSCSC